VSYALFERWVYVNRSRQWSVPSLLRLFVSDVIRHFLVFSWFALSFINRYGYKTIRSSKTNDLSASAARRFANPARLGECAHHRSSPSPRSIRLRSRARAEHPRPQISMHCGQSERLSTCYQWAEWRNPHIGSSHRVILTWSAGRSDGL
jgi:hypothetical protein